MTEQVLSILDLAQRARMAARQMAALDTTQRNTMLRAMAGGIDAHRRDILAANELDIRDAKQDGLSRALIDRLLLNPQRIDAMARGIEVIADLPDPIGQTLSTFEHPAGMSIRKVRVPLGVILIIYESRPNVTADAAALCFKSGNAVILRGGSEAMRSNRAILVAMLQEAMEERSDEATTGTALIDAMQLVPTMDRAAVHELLTMEQCIDLVIPRGGEGLIRTVAEHSTIPVLKHYKGVCHIYVDRAANISMAERIAINAKCQRPGVCNAMETLLVHEEIAETLLPSLAAKLRERHVELRGDARVRDIVQDAGKATSDDWQAEYLDLILAIRIVPDLDTAIEHIERYGSRHSDAIVTEDESAAQRFLRDVDSATVYVNCSTRFTDGAEFGLGAEIGISTDKLHARGPCGLEALTTYKYVIEGSGQIKA